MPHRGFCGVIAGVIRNNALKREWTVRNGHRGRQPM